MEFKAQIACHYTTILSVCVFVSVCCLCDARPKADLTNIENPDNATVKALISESRNGTSYGTDSSNNTTRPSKDIQVNILHKINSIQKRELEQYKAATITLAVLCAVMFLALACLTQRYKAKGATSEPADTPPVVKQPEKECEYQSIRGLPRRETGNSSVYETVKPRLPPSRPTIAYLLHANEDEYENLKSRVRDSDVYLPMNEALVGSGLTGSAIVFPGAEEDLYLTMKKLITTQDEENQTKCDIADV